MDKEADKEAKAVENAWLEKAQKFKTSFCDGKGVCDRAHWMDHGAPDFCYDCLHRPCGCYVSKMCWDKDENAFFARTGTKQDDKKHWLSLPKTQALKEHYSRTEKSEQDSRRAERKA